MKAKAVFFDRDGVLNVDVAYLYKIEDLRWIDGAREAVAYLTQLGYTIFVVTNQSGIARGYYTVEQMNELHAYMQREIAAAGGKIEKSTTARIIQRAACRNIPVCAIVANPNRACCCRRWQTMISTRSRASWSVTVSAMWKQRRLLVSKAIFTQAAICWIS